MQNILGKNIRRLRKEKGITQEALARQFGFTAQLVSKWELGSSNPDILLLPQLAHFFGITVDDLLGYSPEKSADAEKAEPRQQAQREILQAWQRLDDEIAAYAGADDTADSVFTAEERVRLIEKQQEIFRAVCGGEDLADIAAYEEQFHTRLAREYVLLGDTQRALVHLAKAAGIE